MITSTIFTHGSDVNQSLSARRPLALPYDYGIQPHLRRNYIGNRHYNPHCSSVRYEDPSNYVLEQAENKGTGHRPAVTNRISRRVHHRVDWTMCNTPIFEQQSTILRTLRTPDRGILEEGVWCPEKHTRLLYHRPATHCMESSASNKSNVCVKRI